MNILAGVPDWITILNLILWSIAIILRLERLTWEAED